MVPYIAAAAAVARASTPPKHLGHFAPGSGGVAWVFALGRERHHDAGASAVAFGARSTGTTPRSSAGTDQLFRGAGVRRAFEHDELPGANMRRQRGDGALDEAEVGHVGLRPKERRRHADEDGVAAGREREIFAGLKARGQRGGDRCGFDAMDVRAALVERADLVAVDIEARDRGSLLR